MIFTPTSIAGAYIVDLAPIVDERGFFARTWCEEEFGNQGIDFVVRQASISHNRLAGTVRGLHFAWPPSLEGKLVRCERGVIYDVIVDLRPESPTFLLHVGLELEEASRRALYVPPGCAHGFQTLEDETSVYYMMTDFYRAELATGVRFDDPCFGIRWPLPVTVIIDRDRSYPDFDREAHARRFGERVEPTPARC